ncbi:unnamed protein product [Symbiodinium natans]|uniref:Dynamin stalk domain-containing protein n=1 Tax=Symbiodinium natans TaxID=878477 RepID=A0A812UEM7_9DINO|nr:unnamed protein product [Symbiodinium natans]
MGNVVLKGKKHTEVSRPLVGTFAQRPPELVGEDIVFPWKAKLWCPKDGSGSVHGYSLQEVRELIENYQGRELRLPGGPAAYAAAQEIVRKSVQKWRVPATTCINHVAAELCELIENTVAAHARGYPRLEKELRTALLSEATRATEECHRAKEKLLKQELSEDLFTQNEHYLTDSFDKMQGMLKQELGYTVDWTKLDDKEKNDLRGLLAKSGIKNPQQLAEPSEDDDAIWCMSSSLAYHKAHDLMLLLVRGPPRTRSRPSCPFFRVGVPLQPP